MNSTETRAARAAALVAKTDAYTAYEALPFGRAKNKAGRAYQEASNVHTYAQRDHEQAIRREMRAANPNVTEREIMTAANA